MSENPELREARKSLDDATERAEADKPILDYARGVVSAMRAERETNGWAEAVRRNFREGRGAA